MKQILIILIVILSIPAMENRESDSLALATIYYHTNFNLWNYYKSKPLEEWSGIELDSTGRISRLSLVNSDNTFYEIPSQIGLLTNLKYLWIKSNHVDTLPDELGNLINLDTLDIYCKDLKSMGNGIAKMKSLRRLVMFDAFDIALPEDIGELKNLEELMLSLCFMTTLPESFGELSSLRKCMFSGAGIDSLPHSFGKLQNLEKLILHGGNLQSLPTSFGNLSQLKSLTLSTQSEFEIDSASLLQLSNLQELKYRNYANTTFPEFTLLLSGLKKLSLKFQEVSIIPDDISCLEHLEVLELSGNSISNLGKGIYQLQNLDSLLLNECMIGELSEEIGKLSQLSYLDVRTNALTTLPSEITQLDVNAVSLALNHLTRATLPEDVITWLDAGYSSVGDKKLWEQMQSEETTLLHLEEKSPWSITISNNVLTLDGVDCTNLKVSLFSLNGQQLYHDVHLNEVIKLPELSAGYYILGIETGERSKSFVVLL